MRTLACCLTLVEQFGNNVYIIVTFSYQAEVLLCCLVIDHECYEYYAVGHVLLHSSISWSVFRSGMGAIETILYAKHTLKNVFV